MLYLDGLMGLVVLALWIFCLIDVISTDESLCRNLAKPVWLLLVVFLPAVGSLAWLIAGRPQAPADLPYKGNRGTSMPAVHDRERPVHQANPDPDREAAYQRALRARAEEQRQAYRARQQRELGEGPDKT
ncbi:MAG: PLD nuclease N-terminal domain-containing protein [Aeromicrobium sp.]